MGIQFRARTVNQQTPISVTGNINTGWCCGFGGNYSKAKCIAAGGRFIPGAINSNDCATSSLGCSNLTSSGIPIGACCYWQESGGIYTQTCTTTDKLSCSGLNKGESEGLGFSFYPGETCVFEGGNISCNPVKPTADDFLRNCNPNSKDNCYEPKNIYGNCCTNLTKKYPDCSIATKEDCGLGLWTAPNGKSVQSCVKLTPCVGIRTHGTNGALTPASVSSEALEKSSNYILTQPQPGSAYQGGVYVGVFEPGTPINSIGSVVYGNEICGPVSSDYIARGTGSGTVQAKSWILIADDVDYGEYSYNLPNEYIATDMDTSVYDGVHNTYKTESQYTNNLLNSIKYYTKNGFSDWYIPSQDELAYYFKNFEYNFENENFYALKQSQYLTSTTYFSQTNEPFFNSTFIVSQLNTADNYGKIAVAPKTKKMGVRLFRRILIDPVPDNNFIGPGGSEDIFKLPDLAGVCQHRLTCTECLLQAAEDYNDKTKKAKKIYEDAIRRIEDGVDEYGNPVPCPGSKKCCYSDAVANITDNIAQALQNVENTTFDTTKALQLIAILTGISLEALQASYDVQYLFKGKNGQIVLIAANQLRQFIGTAIAEGFDGNFYKIAPTTVFVTTLVDGTRKVLTLEQLLTAFGLNGKLLIKQFSSLSAANLGTFLLELGLYGILSTLLAVIADALLCIDILNEALDNAKKQIYGDPACRTRFGSCKSECSRQQCIGLLGTIKDQYITNVADCCMGPCDVESRETGKPKPAICRNKFPTDPGFKPPDGEPVIWPLGRDDDEATLETDIDRNPEAQYFVRILRRYHNPVDAAVLPPIQPFKFSVLDYSNADDCAAAAGNLYNNEINENLNNFNNETQRLLLQFQKCIDAGLLGYEACAKTYDDAVKNLNEVYNRRFVEIVDRYNERINQCDTLRPPTAA